MSADGAKSKGRLEAQEQEYLMDPIVQDDLPSADCDALSVDAQDWATMDRLGVGYIQRPVLAAEECAVREHLGVPDWVEGIAYGLVEVEVIERTFLGRIYDRVSFVSVRPAVAA